MTISDLHCDQCGSFLVGPGGPGGDADGTEGGPGGDPASDRGAGNGSPDPGAVRFVYHPGKPQLRDTSGLLCASCWDEVEAWLGTQRRPTRCSICGDAVERERSLHVHRFNEARVWRLCKTHAVEFLNRLRTVEPKLDAATFRFP